MTSVNSDSFSMTNFVVLTISLLFGIGCIVYGFLKIKQDYFDVAREKNNMHKKSFKKGKTR